MKITSERSSPYYFLDRNQIQACLEQYIDHLKLKDFMLAPSGLVNTNYILTLQDNQKLVLRIHKNDNLEKGLKEYHISNLLAFSPFVPRVLFFRPSKDKNFSFSFIEYIEGCLLSQVSENSQLDLGKVYFELGIFLSLLRNIKFEAVGLLNENLEVIPIETKNRPHHPTINFILDCLEDGYLVKRMDKKSITKVHDLIISNESLLQKIEEKPHLVHADFKIENILVKRIGNEARLASILDWEYARSDSIYGDIATLFRGDYNHCSLKKQVFLKGCESVGETLIEDWDKASKIIDLINLCYFLCSKEERPILHKIMLKEINDTLDYLIKE